MRAGAGKLQVATVGVAWPPFAAAALPEALVRALPETDGGAIRAGRRRRGARPRGGGRRRPDRARDGRQGGDPGLRRAAAAAPARPAGARRAGPGLRHRRRRLPAAPDGRVVLTPNPTELAHLAARRGGRARGRPGRGARSSSPAGRRRSSAWAGRRRGSPRPDGRLWQDESGGAGSRASPAPATCGPGSPAACWPAAPTRPRPPSGRPTCTAGAGERLAVLGRPAGLPRPGAAGGDPAGVAEIVA